MGASAAPVPPPGRLTLIGTGHVFRIEDAVREAVVALRPDVVFVELDRGRLEALLARRRGEKVPEPDGFIHKRLQRFQESIAGLYGADVGSEMLAAVDGARLVGARILLIDPPARHTVRRVLRDLSWRERVRVLGNVVGGSVKSLFRKRRGRRAVEDEIRRYQDDPESALQQIEHQYPTIYRIVIAERDELMAKAIRKGLAGARHGVAVLGDGHVGGILRRLAHAPAIDTQAFRLADVRGGRLPKAITASGDTQNVRFGFVVPADGPVQDPGPR